MGTDSRAVTLQVPARAARDLERRLRAVVSQTIGIAPLGREATIRTAEFNAATRKLSIELPARVADGLQMILNLAARGH